MAINNKIPVIRALWGETDRTKNEVFQNPIFADEIVITWGVENESFLKSLGYKVVCLSEFSSDANYSTIHSHFMHIMVFEFHYHFLALHKNYHPLVLLNNNPNLKI